MMSAPNILIVEDDNLMAHGISKFLTMKGFHCSTAFSAKECLNKLDDSLDLILLDIGLPDGNGYSLSQRIRQKRKTPILMLTARDEEQNILRGFDSGCDDYMTKPFSMKILLKRVEALLRRSRNLILEREYKWGDLLFDRDNKELSIGEQNIVLARKEKELLSYLIENRGRVVTRDSLLSKLWDDEGNYVDNRTLDVNVSRIRKKLERVGEKYQLIQTVFGIGYKWDDGQ